MHKKNLSIEMKGNYNMKKFLLAALLSSAGILASAQVTATGKVSTWVDNTRIGSASTTGMMTEPTSNIAFSVNEKLAGGLTARAVVETSLAGNTIDGLGTQLGDRQSTVGLSSALGGVDLGRNVHSHFGAIAANDAFGTLYGSIAGHVHNLRGLRFGDAVFVSATPVKGVTVNYERTQSAGLFLANPMFHTTAVVPVNQAEVIAASASFAGISGNVAQYRHGTEKSTVLAASTRLGPAQVFYSHSDNQGQMASKGDLVGAAMTMGAVTAKASYGRTNTDVRAYNVGADYAFSKRTSVGLAYKDVDAAGSWSNQRQIGVGVTHRF